MKKTLKYNKKQSRILSIETQGTEESNLIKIIFSTTTPYPRWFGTDVLEVIGHDEGDMDLSKLQNKAAVLFNHDFDALIGVVEQAWVEEQKGYALIRLSSTAEKYQTMIDEKILNKVSFGYEITEMVKIGEEDGIPVVKVKTIPYELSLVSVPADDNAGILRSQEENKSIEVTVEIELEPEMPEMPEVPEMETDPVEEMADVVGIEYTDETSQDNGYKPEEEKKADYTVKIESQELFDKSNNILENVNINFNKGKLTMKEILALGRSVGEMELAVEFVEAGKSLEQFKDALIEKKTSTASTVDAGTHKEQKKFSLAGFIAEQAESKDGYHTGMAREMAKDFAGYKTMGKGFILPKSIFARDYAVGGNAGQTASEDYRTQVIEQLYNTSVVLPLINRLPDASGYGSVKYPKLTGKNSFQFLTENQRATESNADFGDVVFTPKTIGGRVVLSRDILKQSTLMIENIARTELMKAKDEFLDNELLNGTAGWQGIFNTVGAEIVEFGANGGAMDYAKVVEFGTRIDSNNAHTAGLSFITNSKVLGAMKTTQQFPTYGAPIYANGQADGYPVFVSNQVGSDYAKGTGTNLSAMALINGSMAHFIEWGGIELVVNPYRLGAGQLEIELFMTADFQVSHTEGIVLAKDIDA
jgi:HK97 family phage major capsid protein/HK97 family phage prohead protease